MASEVKRKGQVAIWIILAVVILGVILFFLLFRGEITPEITPSGDSLNEKSFMEQCIQNSVSEATEILLPQGGFIDPVNYRRYNETRVAFLCENKGFYDPCIQQHPLLITEIEREIDEYISPRIDDCFSELVRESERDGVEVISSPGLADVNVNLEQEVISVVIDKKVTFIEKGQSRDVRSFDFEIVNSAYNLASVALEIAAQEADHCYFEYVGYSAIYPRYQIKPFGVSDSVIIYEIIDSKTRQSMHIAIRSCAIPAGI